MNKISTNLAFAFVFIFNCAAATVNFYVAPNGNDANSGTKNLPFRSLERARDAIRNLKTNATFQADSISVVIRGGTYLLKTNFVLDARDSAGTTPIIWTAAPNEVVRLCGGILVPPNTFHAVANKTILTRLDANTRSHVLELNLRDVGISKLEKYPDEFRGAPDAPELFFNDRRQQVARWPNDGWATISKIISAGTNQFQPAAFEYSGDRTNHWNVNDGVWLLGFWCYDWYEENVRVKSIDWRSNQITLAVSPHYGIRQGNPLPRRWRAENILEELDEPGEYYIDVASDELYFWPPSKLSGARIVLSALDAPLIQLNNVSNVVIRGFVVEDGLRNGIDVRDGSDNCISNCEVRNFRELGIRISGGVDHRVVNCNVHDLGTGGIILSGGDRKTLTPAGLQAVNNRIWNFAGHQLTYASGIVLSGVGNRAAHNEIFGAPHMAVGINGNDHVFEFNYVHDVCATSDDSGGLYKGRNPSCRGNIIRYNYWRDIGNPSASGTAAIYFDDGDGGDMVFGNIFLRCGYMSKGSFGTVFSHGGHGIFAENNIFVDCKRALGSAPWDDKHWKEMLDGELWQNELLKEVDITTAPYTNHYPALIGFMNGQPQSERINYPDNNVYVRCQLPNSGNWTNAPGKFFSTTNNPGFVNFAKGNLQLRADSEVFKQLPEFKPIPFEEIGIEK